MTATPPRAGRQHRRHAAGVNAADGDHGNLQGPGDLPDRGHATGRLVGMGGCGKDVTKGDPISPLGLRLEGIAHAMHRDA